MNNNRGFTLIELIAVIVIIGILTVTAAPRLLTQSDFSDRTVRNQIISQLRLAQLKALNDRSGCYQVRIDNNSIDIFQTTVVANVCDTANYVISADSSLIEDTVVAIGASSTASTTLIIAFDSLGRPKTEAGAHCVTGSQCVLNVVADDASNVCIESEGYAHGC